jgi:AbrB family looped-hinge helix DNA binding protein
MTKLSSKDRITLPKSLGDRLGLKVGEQIYFSLNVSGEIVLKPAQKSLPNAAQDYRAALLAVRGTADKRFATTDDFMRFVRG